MSKAVIRLIVRTAVLPTLSLLVVMVLAFFASDNLERVPIWLNMGIVLLGAYFAGVFISRSLVFLSTVETIRRGDHFEFFTTDGKSYIARTAQRVRLDAYGNQGMTLTDGQVYITLPMSSIKKVVIFNSVNGIETVMLDTFIKRYRL